MRPVRPVYIAAQAVTPFIGKGHPDFILKGHPDFGKRDTPRWKTTWSASYARCWRITTSTPV